MWRSPFRRIISVYETLPRPHFHVFVDETGDRSLSASSSPLFAVSAVIVPNDDIRAAHAMLDQLCSDFNKPPRTVLHWARNLKPHHHRKHLAETFGRARIGVFNVLVVKDALGEATSLQDGTSMYNYAIRRLLERVSWFIDKRGGDATITFAHIRNFPYERLVSYLTLLRQRQTTIRWRALRGEPRLDQPSRVRGLQLADCTAGILSSAVHPDSHGKFEPAYLHALIPRLYKVPSRPITSYGMNVIGENGCMNRFPWWHEFATACS